jgi:hypothetical protein
MDSFKLYKQSKPAQLLFLEWLLEQEQGVHAYMNANPKDPTNKDKDFLNFGNSYDIKDDLKKFKTSTGSRMFNFFNLTWSTPRSNLDDSIINQLIELTGISDLKNIIDGKAANGALIPVVGRGPENIDPTQVLSDPTQGAAKGPVDTVLANMEKEIEKAAKKTKGTAKEIFASIEKHLEQLAASVDKEAQGEYVKDFLKFASKFYRYSFYNQMLIYVQKKNATYVNTKARWLKMGRTVTKWNEGITIVVPFFGKTKDKDADSTPPASEKDKRAIYFGTGKVYDISATEILPGQEDKAKVFEPNDWQQDTDENTEELTIMINAGLEFAKEKSIDIDYEKLAAGHGGYSAGGKIVINDTYGGINKFSTLVHELAHEILHQVLSGTERAEEKKIDPGVLEWDAESTAYIVLQHFGFETKDSARYLALWQGTAEKIKSRKTNIQKACKEIIDGIHDNMIEEIEDKEKEKEKEEEPVTV